ncbi:unnamed protein product [Heligmosomoides polygyrus]|uniref:Receptor L-domain domain-containing protein n=1 Tax=Heligmosomoides polygyrus TaxID=6339 RepID=A0A3P8C211_HELPZ|nr:unnamed protein product [Heligmosomoides polygyrus]
MTTAYTQTIEDNCSGIYGKFVLPSTDRPASDVLLRKFGNATQLVGEITIVGTDVVDLSFLRNVGKIIPSYLNVKDREAKMYIRIENNSKLERLGWDMLQEVLIVAIHISNNPKLCYLTTELDALFTTRDLDAVQGRICEAGPTDIEPPTQCRIGNEGNLSSIPGECQSLIGRLTIDQSSSPYDFWKLYNITTIYGQLTVRNASIKGLSPLWKLTQIVNLAPNESALIVESNKHMKSAFMSGIELVLSDEPVQIINNTVMKLLEEECTALGRSVDISSAGNRKNCPGRSKMGSELFDVSQYGTTMLCSVVMCTRFLYSP